MHLLTKTAVNAETCHFGLTSLGARALTDAESFPSIPRNKLLLLSAIIMQGEAYGFQLFKYLKGMIPRGQIYITLKHMVDDKLIEIARTEENPRSVFHPAKYFRATDHGLSIYHC